MVGICEKFRQTFGPQDKDHQEASLDRSLKIYNVVAFDMLQRPFEAENTEKMKNMQYGLQK